MMNKWDIAHEIGSRLASVEATPAVLKLLDAARAHSSAIEARVRFAVKSLSRSAELPEDILDLIESMDETGQRPLTLRFRVSAEEHANITDRAEAVGATVSQYIRSKILKSLKPPGRKE